MKTRKRIIREPYGQCFMYSLKGRGLTDFNRLHRGETSFWDYLKWGAAIIFISASLAFIGSYFSNQDYRNSGFSINSLKSNKYVGKSLDEIIQPDLNFSR